MLPRPTGSTRTDTHFPYTTLFRAISSSTKASKVIVNVKTKLSDCLRPLMLGALFLGTAANAAVQPIDKVVAIVDNDVVMQSQLDQRVHEVQQTIAKRGGDRKSTRLNSSH